MANQSKPEIIFKSQPTSYWPRGKNILLKKSHGHIKGTGKSKFPKIQIKNTCGKKLLLVVEPVYAGNITLRHHYRLVKYDKLKKNLPLTAIMDPLCYKLDGTKKVNNIDLQIVVMPPQAEYKRPGVDEEVMKKFKDEGDLNEKKMVLSCKIYLSKEDFKNGENAIATKYSNPLKNSSQRLKDHKLVGEGSVDGGTVIQLPFSQDHPNTLYEVRFSNKKGKFIAYGKIVRTCSQWMYVETPAYILEEREEPEELAENVKISVHIVRVHDLLLSKEFHFEYTPREIETPNSSSAGTSQDEIITITDVLSMRKKDDDDDKMNILIICTPISLPEEYVNKNIIVRFSENNIKYTDVEIKEFDPTMNKGLLILETPFDFYEQFGNYATIQIYNKRCNTFSEKFEMKFPKLKTEKNIKKPKISVDAASTSTDLSDQFQNDPDQQEQSDHNQRKTYSEPNSPDNCGKILKDVIDEMNPSELDNFDLVEMCDLSMNPNCAD